MKQCPGCGQTSDSFVASGPLVWGKASVVYHDNGRVVVGPIVPSVVLKPNAEFRDKSACNLQCPSCKKTYPIGDFKTIVPCAINPKKIGTHLLTFHDGLSFYVSDEQLAVGVDIAALAGKLAKKKDPYEEFAFA